MKRRYFYLKENKRQKLSYHWLFFDTEAQITQVDKSVQRHTFRLGYAIYWRLNKNLHICEEQHAILRQASDLLHFILALVDRKETLHVVAHNVGYDLQLTGLLEQLTAAGFEVTFIYLQEPTLIVKLHKGHCRIVLEDGYNRLRGSIADWGAKIGRPKLSVDFSQVSDDELLNYCRRDVEILAHAHLEYLRFVQAHDLGSLRYTVSGQALQAYKHRFMRHKIRMTMVETVLQLEREAYGGGMVRVFRRGHFEGEQYYQLDVNSMYGYVMSSCDYPVKLICYREHVDTSYLARFADKYALIAKCTVKPKVPRYRCQHLGKITYPCTEFTGTFTTEEIRLLLQENAIMEVEKVAVYRKAKIFTDYVGYFWELRHKAMTQNDMVMKELAKQFLNSLYGKFGARARMWVRCEEAESPAGHVEMFGDTRTGELRSVIYIGGKAYINIDEGEAGESMPAIAAHVTANARLTLWKFVELAGLENVYYTDTDSLIVSQDGYQRLRAYIDREKLGYLKLEKVADSLSVWARKDYQLGDKVVIKGVNKPYRIPDAAAYYRECWQSFESYLQHLGVPEVIITTRKLHLTRACYDGRVDVDGKVIPFTELPSTWSVTDDIPVL